MDFRFTALILLSMCSFVIAPLPNRSERAGVATVDSVLDRISSGLRNIQRSFAMNRTSPDIALRTVAELRVNLLRIRSLVDRGCFDDLETSLRVIENRLNLQRTAARTNFQDDPPAQTVSERQRRTRNDTGNDQRTVSRVNIDQGRLEHFMNIGLNVRYIARNSERLLGGKVHYNTLHRFIQRHNMVAPRHRFTQISNATLEIVI